MSRYSLVVWAALKIDLYLFSFQMESSFLSQEMSGGVNITDLCKQIIWLITLTVLKTGGLSFWKVISKTSVSILFIILLIDNHKGRVQTSFFRVFPESTDTKPSGLTHSGHYLALIWVSYSSIFLLWNWITDTKPQTQSQQWMSDGSWWETMPKEKRICFPFLVKGSPVLGRVLEDTWNIRALNLLFF